MDQTTTPINSVTPVTNTISTPMSPIASPALNIDSMLAGLSTHTEEVIQNDTVAIPVIESTNTEDSSPSTSTTPSAGMTFSIDNLTKPTNPDISTDINPNTATVTSNTISTNKVKHILKNVLPIVMTFTLLVVAGWVISIQYPLETKGFFDGIFGVVDTMSQSAQQGLNPDEITVGETPVDDEIEEIAMIEIHNAANDVPVIAYDINTPLADSINAAQQQTALPSSQEDLLGEIVGTSDTTTIDNTTTSTSSTEDSTALPTVQAFQTDVLTLSQQAEEAMTELVGGNPSKQARVKIIYNNTQTMLTTLSQTQTVTQQMVDDLATLQGIYQGLFN